MSKLHRYASKADLMNISIKYGEEKFKFNLYEELVINENNINDELLVNPQSYGFLCMLHKKYARIKEDKDIERNKAWSKVYIDYKNDLDPETGKVYNNDMAKAHADVSEEYAKANKEYLDALENLGILDTCVKSFEQRSFLMQTLSANLRKQS